MITTKLQGGLGNQLSQWATTRSLAAKYNVPYFFDKSYFNSIGGGSVTKWDFELDKFKNLTINEPPNRTGLHHVYDNFHYNANISDNSFLDGYWQSEKYFIENRDLIIGDLAIPKISIPDMYDDSHVPKKYRLKGPTIGLHVRRGDYVNLQQYHILQTVKYYEDAFDLINIKDAVVVIFSNDIDWCKNNFKFNQMHFIEGNSNIVDLQLMSNCDHNIIANSSFSWWGAWLNQDENKIVVAPKVWYGPAYSHMPTVDIYAKNWYVI